MSKMTNNNMSQYMAQVLTTVRTWMDESGYIDSSEDDVPLVLLAARLTPLLSGMLTQILAQKDKKLRDPDAPKRGKNAFLFFCDDERKGVQASLGKQAKMGDVMTELSARWKQLQDSGKKADKARVDKYNKLAEADKERYMSAKEGYAAPTAEEILAKVNAEKEAKAKARKQAAAKAKDPDAPKKPLTAYMRFCANHREEIRNGKGFDDKGKPIRTGLETNDILNRMWKELNANPTKELAKLQKAVEKDKAKYDEEMERHSSSHSGSGTDMEDDLNNE
jgi:hypothetical protein